MQAGTHSSSPSARPTWEVLFHPASRRLGVVLLVLAFVLPVEGLGVDLCWFHGVTGLPCPGCGITRSLLHLARGDWGEAARLHPFGPLVWALVWASALLELAGEGARARVRAWLAARETVARFAYRSVIGAFLAYGVVRLAAAALGLDWLPVPP